MKNLTNKMVLVLFALALTACGSGGGEGGGGGGGGGGNSGSAVLQSFTATAPANNVCRNYTVPTDSTSCTNAGGTWTSRNTSTISSGSLDGSYNATCSSGTATVTCSVSGVGFAVNGNPAATSLSLDHVNSCGDVGGTVNVSCASVSGTEDYCNISAPTNSTDCAAVGGTFYASLQSATGSVTGERIVAGSNTVQILIDYPAVDTVDVVALNPQSPVYFNFTVKIQDSFANTFWTSTQSRTTGSSFGSSQGYDTFSFTSPVAADDGVGRLVIDTGTLFFQ